MTQRALAALAAAVLALSLGATPTMAIASASDGQHPAKRDNPLHTGTVNTGSYADNNFQGGQSVTYGSDVYVWWSRASQDPSGTGHLKGVVTTGQLPLINGHPSCVQAAADWEVPQFSTHFDVRVVRNCVANSVVRFDFSVAGYYERNPICPNPPAGHQDCDMAIQRVQIARYVPDTGNVVNNTAECYWPGSSEPGHDCTDWSPTCYESNEGCQGWIKPVSGNAFVRNPSPPNSELSPTS